MNYYNTIMLLTGAILIILSVLVHENARLSKTEKQHYYISYIIVAMAAISEWCGLYFSGKTQYNVFLIYIFKFMDYIFTPSSGAALIWNIQSNKTLKKIVLLILGANIVFQAICLLNGGVFYVDVNNIYHHGPLYPVYIAFYGVILLVSAFAFFEYGRNFAKENKLSMYLIIMLAVAGIVVQEFIGDNLRIAYLTLSISLGLLYIRSSEFSQQLSDDKIKNQQYQIMFSQIQPHFLFNCLTVIRATYHSDIEKGDDAILQFSNFLRYNMDSLSKNSLVPFEKELEHVKEYVALQLLRFRDSLEVIYDLKCTDFELPVLTLQPIVENAIRHGARQKEDGVGRVTVTSSEEENYYIIQVVDNGPGFDTTQKPKDGRSHVGIENVNDRLNSIVGGKLRIDSVKDHGTTVTIIIPKSIDSK